MLQARLGFSTSRTSLQVRVLGVQAWTWAVADSHPSRLRLRGSSQGGPQGRLAL